MFPMLLAVLPLLASLATVFAQTESEVVVVDFYTGVHYNPPDAWHSGSNSACSTVDHYTTEVNATATISFVGDRIAVYGMNNDESGVLDIQADNQSVYALNLWSSTVKCGLFVDYYLGNGSHTLTLTLRGVDAVINSTVDGVTEGPVQTPVLHLTDIVYWVPLPASAVASGTPVPSDESSVAGDLSSNHKNITAIVAGTVCGVVGLIALVIGILFFWKKRRATKKRHSFNPNTVYITELSPRTATSPDSAAKFGAYAQFDDDLETKSIETKAAGLGVPEMQYTKSGLRSRSRSPMPDRKSMP